MDMLLTARGIEGIWQVRTSYFAVQVQLLNKNCKYRLYMLLQKVNS
jgi:hypothetical protein